MLIIFKKLIYLIMIAVMLTACSTKAVMGDKNGQTGTGEKSKGIFSIEPSDRELFEEAVSCLSDNQKEPNYQEVKGKLENMVAKYPQSKWVKSAQALIYSLDRISELQLQLNKEKQKSQGDHEKLTKEIEGLKKENTEKYSSEIIRLQQENEQLKNDIQQLKNLEIQLEKREKTLR